MHRVSARKSFTFGILVLVFAAFTFASQSFASPARLITFPPIIKTGNPNTGPTFDPTATQGQWFMNFNTTGSQFESRPWEFYDNNDVQGALGSQRIRGGVQNITFGGAGGNITGFQIVATITNDLPQPDLGQPGRNSHGENLLPPTPTFQGTMFNVKMTTEFAFPSRVVVPVNVLNQIAANQAPYTLPDYGNGQGVVIQAQNEDQEGWYCFTPPNGLGGFYVPTFDFGNIAPGASVSRTLSFVIPGAGLSPGNPLFPQLINWAATNADVLMNRTTDLKIGDWVDILAQDTGLPYPVPSFRSGDVSVFFTVPEPTTLAILAPIGLLALRRRSRAAVAA